MKTEEYVKDLRFKTIRKHIKGKRLLDIGCKDAVLTKYISKSISYTAMDLEALTDKVTVVTADASYDTFPFPDNSFDCVVISEVMEHLENPSHCLREINRVLAPGGRVIITIPNVESLNTLLNGMFRVPYYVSKKPVPGGHINAYGTDELSNLLKLCGFRIKVLKKIVCGIAGLGIRFPDTSLFAPFGTYTMAVATKHKSH